jgi:hypothetical protein
MNASLDKKKGIPHRLSEEGRMRDAGMPGGRGHRDVNMS